MDMDVNEEREYEHSNLVDDDLMDTLNPEIRKLLIETNTNIADPKDIEALSNVSVRELTNLFDNITKGMTKQQAFNELRVAAVKKMEEKKRIKESLQRIKEEFEALLESIQTMNSTELAIIVAGEQERIDEANDRQRDEEARAMSSNLAIVQEKLALRRMEEEKEKQRLEMEEIKRLEEERKRQQQQEEEEQRRQEQLEQQLKEIENTTREETFDQVNQRIIDLQERIEEIKDLEDKESREELVTNRNILEKLSDIGTTKKEIEEKALKERVASLRIDIEESSVEELRKLMEQKNEQWKELESREAEQSVVEEELKMIQERLKAIEPSPMNEMSPSAGSNTANEESLTSEADQTGTGGGEDDNDNDSNDEDNADGISLPEGFNMNEFLSGIDNPRIGDGEEAEQVPVYTYDIEYLDKKTWLYHCFNVTKYDHKNRFLRKKSRTWEVDFFGKQLNNMSRKGKIKKSLNPENLFRLERIPSDNKRILMGFYGSRHSYELAFNSNELRERFYESMAAMRPSEFSWCPDICKPGEETSRTILHGKFTATSPRGLKKKIEGEARVNVTSNPREDINLFCSTWNMGKHAAPKNPQVLKSFITSRTFDMYAIGIVDTGFTRVSDLTSYVLEYLGSDYFCVASTSQSSMQLAIFSRKKNFVKISNVECQSKATGIMGFGNKGGVAIGLRYNETSILFMNAYLASDKSVKADSETTIKAEGSKLRMQNVQEILDSCRFKNRELDLYSQFHHIFFMGDLNYRVGLSANDAMRLINSKRYTELAKYDQLREEMYLGRLLAEFKEAEISFPPTYKYIVGTKDYDIMNGRIPSYTDRVLYKSLPGCDITCEEYGSCSDITTSDQFPLYAHFKVCTIRPYVSIFSRIVPNYLLVIEELFISGRSTSMARPMVTFYSEFIPSNESTPKHGARSVNPIWTARQLPTLRLSTSNTDFLRVQHLLVSLRDGPAKGENIDNLIGTTAVPLSSVVDSMPEPAEIELPMYRHGVVSCNMVIKMHLMS